MQKINVGRAIGIMLKLHDMKRCDLAKATGRAESSVGAWMVRDHSKLETIELICNSVPAWTIEEFMSHAIIESE